jgi:hypothetical protein
MIGRFLNIFFSVTAWSNDQSLVGSTYGGFCKSTNQKQELPVVAMFVHGLELNEQSL